MRSLAQKNDNFVQYQEKWNCVANKYYLCQKEQETVNHLFLHCKKSILWNLALYLGTAN